MPFKLCNITLFYVPLSMNTFYLEKIRKDFIEWIEFKTMSPFNINDKLLLACLDEAINEVLNTTHKINGVVQPQKIGQDLHLEILQHWHKVCDLILLPPQEKNLGLTFRSVQVPHNENERHRLLEMLSPLKNLYE